MFMVATQNFRSVDRLLAAPSARAAESIAKLGPEEARSFLRYQVSEQNRWYFQTWELAQLALGSLFVLSIFLGHTSSRPGLLLPALMLAAVAIAHWFLTPEIVRLGRAIDFLPPGQPSPERTRFWNYHIAYSTIETAKMLLGAIVAFGLLKRRRWHRAEAGRQVASTEYAPR